MKELKEQSVYLEEYGVNVSKYISYSQIQEIVKAVKMFKTWAEREETLDMLLLLYATDIGKEKLEELGHAVLHKSGLISQVHFACESYGEIQEALVYEESLAKALFDLSKNMPDITKQLQEVVEKHGKTV